MASSRLEPLPGLDRHPTASEASKKKLLSHLKSIHVRSNVKRCSREYYLRVKEREGCYPMENSSRGRALVVTMTAKREGWESDVIALHELFLYLDIKPHYLFDLTGKNLVKALERFASNSNNKNVDCLFIILMGHGGQIQQGENMNKEYLLTSDNRGFLIREHIASTFSNQKHQHLVNKPKVFLVQMCRGDVGSQGIDIYQSPLESDAADALVVRPVARTSSFSDYIISFASQPGTKSMRDTVQGTRYIQEVCRVFLNKASEKQVEDLLKEVNRTLKKKAAELCEEHVQVGEYVSSTDAPLYLFPGLDVSHGVEEGPLSGADVTEQSRTPKLYCKLEWDIQKHGPVEGLMAFRTSQDDCLVGCRGHAGLCLGYKCSIRQYTAGCKEQEVWDMCTYEQDLFLIQSKSVTVHDLNRQQSPYEVKLQDQGSREIRAGVAIGSGALALVDWELGQIVGYKLGEQHLKILVSGVCIPARLCRHGEGENCRYFLTENEEHRVRVYNHSWQLVNTISSFGFADGELRFPMDTSITEEGTILVADTGNWRISEFSSNGDFLCHRLTRKYLREGEPHRISVMGEILWVNVVDKEKKHEVILKFKLPT